MEKTYQRTTSLSSWSSFSQYNLVDNQYQRKSEVWYTFNSNKSYVYLLHVEPSNLVSLKTYSTEFDEIIIKLTDQNEKTLEIEDKVNLTLLTNKQKWRKKDMFFLSFARKY